MSFLLGELRNDVVLAEARLPLDHLELASRWK
jgi:hypothetical protein